MSNAWSEIDVDAARERLGDFRIVDVREPAEFEGPLGHIAGAELIPLGSVADAAPQLREGKPLLVVCRSGNRSGKACARLAELGVLAPTNLAGGMIAWNREELPAERRRPGDAGAWLDGLREWLAVFGRAGEAGARSRIADRLRALDTSPEAAGSRELLALLAALEQELLAGEPPADLDVVMKAFRADAEAFPGAS